MAEEKESIELNLEKMVVATYQKIAEWHNEDGTKEGLKVSAYDIVETILNMTFEEFNVKSKSGVKEELLKKTVEEYNKRKQETLESSQQNLNTDKKEDKDKNIFKRIF